MTDSRESCWRGTQVPEDQTVAGRITPDVGDSIGPSALGNRTWGLGWLIDESQFLRRQSSGMEFLAVFVFMPIPWGSFVVDAELGLKFSP
jgi:hypothetical protein